MIYRKNDSTVQINRCTCSDFNHPHRNVFPGDILNGASLTMNNLRFSLLGLWLTTFGSKTENQGFLGTVIRNDGHKIMIHTV